jgi:ADP-heptose:LPS heptosyltransferase
VTNLAGRTDLPTYVKHLSASRLLVTNDTGGMHLANALGVPLIALFGPTNPVRTGPVFATPAHILQPPGCPPTGGGALIDLTPATVIAAVKQNLPFAPKQSVTPPTV